MREHRILHQWWSSMWRESSLMWIYQISSVLYECSILSSTVINYHFLLHLWWLLMYTPEATILVIHIVYIIYLESIIINTHILSTNTQLRRNVSRREATFVNIENIESTMGSSSVAWSRIRMFIKLCNRIDKSGWVSTVHCYLTMIDLMNVKMLLRVFDRRCRWRMWAVHAFLSWRTYNFIYENFNWWSS